MKKINLIVLSAVAASAFALSGCSGSSASSPAATTAAGTETAETTAAAESSAAAEGAASEAAAQTTADAEAIAAINPVKPDSLGTVELGDLTKLEITAPIAETIGDEQIDNYIKNYSLYGQTKEVDGAAADGDIVNIDFEGKKDGVAFEGGTSQGYDLTLGSGSFIDGFESGLIGTKAGDKVSLNLKFPDEYQAEELAGQEVVFDVTVNKVTRPLEMEDLDDAKVEEISGGNYKTVTEYREGIREALQQSEDSFAKGELYANAIAEATKLCKTDVTDDAVEWQIDTYLQNYDKSLSTSYGMGLAELISYYGQTYADFRDGLKEEAKTTTAQSAVVDAIAREQGFAYNDEALQDYLKDYGYSEELIKNGTTEDWLKETVLQYLVGRYLSENAAVNYISYADYEAQMYGDTTAAADTTETAAETTEAAKQ
ncbi:MAG: trigger factor [Eubacteriales bacterium]|nr:trigger factor [Eubacteriales bacterium]